MRVCLVGDMHAVPEELADCVKVIQLIKDTCRVENIQDVVFMGDQHHTHSLMRLEVMHWWKCAFKSLKSEGLKVTCLVGNHDQAGPGAMAHAMMAYQGEVTIVDHPVVKDGVLFLPYYHTQAEFVAACQQYPDVKTALVHQTFDGSTYENGFLASDGFDPNLVPQDLLISGHIHTPQEFGKIWYIGAPRWRSLSDANVERSIWCIDLDHGTLKDRRPYTTGGVCRRIFHLEDTPEKPAQLPLDPQHQWRIDVKGPPAYCNTRKTELHAAGARVRTFPTQVSLVGKIRESEGIDKAFRTFVASYQPKYGTSLEDLTTLAMARL